MSITFALNSLRAEQKQLETRLKQVEAAISSLMGLNGDSPRGGKRTISAAGRARIAAAQRKRWAKVRAAQK
jgi:hypothetical protein